MSSIVAIRMHMNALYKKGPISVAFLTLFKNVTFELIQNEFYHLFHSKIQQWQKSYTILFLQLLKVEKCSSYINIDGKKVKNLKLGGSAHLQKV